MPILDLSSYYPIPWLSTEGYVSMTNDLLAVAPNAPPPHVEVATKSLRATGTEVKSGLVSRIDEDLSTGAERSFDVFVDRVWFEVRSRLEFWDLYRHDGIQKLTSEDLEAIDYEKQQERARAASTILTKMFGDGVEFLRERFPQQAAHMAARLDWIEHKQLDGTLSELITPELVQLLGVCQTRYEAMVSERSSRDGKSGANLRELRNKLRMQIYSYCGAIGTLYDPSLPESANVVEAALRPILSYRAQGRRKGAALVEDEVAGEDEGGLEGEGVDGFEAGQDEAQADAGLDAEAEPKPPAPVEIGG